MAKKTTGLEPAQKDSAAKRKKLTWRQERFIEAYIDNGGNAVQAYRAAYPGCATSTARAHGHLMLRTVEDSIAEKREELKNLLNFDRDKALRIYLGMALSRQSDFVRVMDDPNNRANYSGLGVLEYGLESVEKTVTDTQHGKSVKTSVKLVNRKAAVDELVRILGLDKATGEKDRQSILERFDGALERLRGSRGEGTR